MKTGWVKKLFCLLCLGLPVVLAAVATAQSEPPSILDRVQKVDDPELAGLIRVAIESRENLSQKERLEIIRKVTLSYVQIKLLDQQVAEVSRKIDAETGPAEMRHELLLAKTELESKLMTELANLREIMGIIPRHAFEEQPIPTLSAYISLQIIGERVYVLDGQKPFSNYWIRQRWKLAGWLSEKETLDYVREKLKDKNSLPIRIEIYYAPETKGVSEDLRNKIIGLARETHSQMDTEVRLNLISFTGSGESEFFVRQGKITTFYTNAMQRPDGGPEPFSSGLVNPNDLEQHILWRLTKPKNVPLTFRIEYDEPSALVAKLVADTARDVVKRLGIAELVGVESILVKPAPETAFLGRWRGTARGDFQAIDVQPNGLCQVTMGDRFRRDAPFGAIKAETGVSGTWLLTTKEIVIDINDKIRHPDGSEYVYRGYIDEEGNLIVDKGQIYPQGSFAVSGAPRQMILKRLE